MTFLPHASSAWENEPPEPNPVAEIIATRTLQVGVGALALQTALRCLLRDPDRARWASWGAAGVTVGLSGYFAATFSARVPLGGARLVTRLPRSAGPGAVALTFDDGPHPDTTPRLLDILAAHQAKATFFLIGERASRHPDLARRITDEGHTVGVHGLRHRTMVLTSGPQLRRELREAVRRIEDATGQALPSPRLLRPPYGFKTVTLCRVAGREGFQIVAWNVDGRDYDDPPPNILTARLLSRLTPGAIVLLHERPRRPETLEATLPVLLAEIRARGLRPVPVTV